MNASGKITKSEIENFSIEKFGEKRERETLKNIKKCKGECSSALRK